MFHDLLILGRLGVYMAGLLSAFLATDGDVTFSLRLGIATVVFFRGRPGSIFSAFST